MFQDIRTFPMGSGPVIARMFDELGWGPIIDQRVAPGPYKLPVWLRIKALLINIGTDRTALYRVEEFYAKRDVEVLLGEGVSASDLNDDALARALDSLYEAGLEELYTTIAMHTLRKLRVINPDELFAIHADTTSLSLTGEYPDQSEFRIDRGFSKDNRPDLKQIVFGLCTVRGIGICANVNPGNLDDHTWNHETIQKMLAQLDAEMRETGVYVADAAMVTKENLQLLADENVHFISRLPGTYKLSEQLKHAAWQREDKWQEVGRLAEARDGASYKIQSFRRELYGRTYRFVVVRSSSLDARKEHKLDSVLEQEQKELQKAAKLLGKNVYSCEQDAQMAADAFVHEHRGTLHRLKMSVRPEQVQEKRARRGRPRKDEPVPPMRTQYRVDVEILPPEEEQVQAWREREATFVLITDIRDDQRVPDEQILQLYKEQHEVEVRFRYLKAPYHVGPVFLHKPTRVKAFGFLMLLSLLLYSALEYLIRERMKTEQEPLILPGKRKSFRPTGLSILEMLDAMATVQVKVGGVWHRTPVRPHDPQIERVLKLLGMDLSIYAEVQKIA
ncbi:IS1634 family transposase [Alicyclobacillus macrosporangiidus]|uniref:IS1634 family transposase n=1 Tax=Alicyclobacillus macrosporangiidus TaxID=392015 RepID=UPI0026F36D82|nr:IS1634 family transposase [Alicyclobacillus macrosporangiidus]